MLYPVRIKDRDRLLQTPRGKRILRPIVVIPLLCLLVLLIAPCAFRAMCITRMPLVEEPFDPVPLLEVELPHAENAFTHYKAAMALIPPSDSVAWEVQDALEKMVRDVVKHGWEMSTPELEQLLKDNEVAVAEFRQGAKLSRSLSSPLATRDAITTLTMQVETMRHLPRVVVAMACRHMMQGEYEEAWKLLHDVFRASGHASQYSDLTARLTDQVMFSQAAWQLQQWAAGESVTAEDLRTARQQFQEAWKLHPPYSESLKVQYVTLLNSFDQMANMFMFAESGEQWLYAHMEVSMLWVMGEPELNERALRFWLQNHLPFVDKEPWERPPMDSHELFFDASSALTVNGAVIPVEEAAKAVQPSMISSLIPYFVKVMKAHDRQLARYRVCVCVLAAQEYRRDHGNFPATLTDLVPKYLDKIPSDPYDDSPLKYRAEPAPPAVYSVYEDAIDNGGIDISFDEDNGIDGKDPLDLGYLLLKPGEKIPGLSPVEKTDTSGG